MVISLYLEKRNILSIQKPFSDSVKKKILIVGFIASLFILLININKNICQQCSFINWNHSLSTDPRVWQEKKEPKHSPKVDHLYGIYNTEHQILCDRKFCATHFLYVR